MKNSANVYECTYKMDGGTLWPNGLRPTFVSIKIPRFMKKYWLVMAALWLLTLPSVAQRQMEKLDRGLVVVNKGSNQAFLSWRFLATDPDDIAFNLYRSTGSEKAKKTKLNSRPVTGATNFVWSIPSGVTAFEIDTWYFVAPVIDGVEQAVDGSWKVPAKQAANRIVRDFDYHPLPAGWPKMMMKFCWVGDLDGDGRYDFVISRMGGDASDEDDEAASVNQTVPSVIEAYTSEGKFLWRMSMGFNVAICTGHNDMVTVYDMDGDGKAEVMMCVSEGTVFADGTEVRNADGTVHDYSKSAGSAPQWVAVVNGQTGAFITKTDLPHAKAIATGRSDKWKDISGHFIINYLDGIHPSLVYEYKNRQTSGLFTGAYAAWRLVEGQWQQQYASRFSRNEQQYEGHQLRAADVDGDGKDEFVEISYVIDDDGSQSVQAENVAHGDRHCLTDIDPDHPGLEHFFIQQTNTLGMGTWDLETGKLLTSHYMSATSDVGRGMCAALDPGRRGLQYFSTMNSYQLYDCKGNLIDGAKGAFPAEALWWGGELSRYMVTPVGNGGYNIAFSKYNTSSKQLERVTPNFYNEGSAYYLQAYYAGRASFWGDILGDWREEMVLARRDTTGFAVVTTWDLTDHRQYCLMQNPAYRIQTTARGYYQTPDVDFYMAADMPLPPVAAVQQADVYLTDETALKAAQIDSLSVMLDIRNPNGVIALNDTVVPARLWLMNPLGHDYVIEGTGSIAGPGDVVKSLQGSVTLRGKHGYTGQTRISEGKLFIDGSLASPVTVNARGTVGGRGRLGGGVRMEAGLNTAGGRIEPGFGETLGRLTLAGDLQLSGRNHIVIDVDQRQAGKNDTLFIEGGLSLQGVENALIFNLISELQSDTLTFLGCGDSIGTDVSAWKIIGLEGIPYTLYQDGNWLKLAIEKPRTASTVVWTGHYSNVWDFKTSNFTCNGKEVIFVPGDTVVFGDEAERTGVSLSETLPVGAMLFNNTKAYTLSGSGVISGEGGLTKTGSGKLTIQLKNNTFTGAVDFSDGVLAVALLSNGGVASSIGASGASAANWVMRNATLQPLGQLSTDRAMKGEGRLTVECASSNSVLFKGNLSAHRLDAKGSGVVNLAGVNKFDSVFVYGGTVTCGSVSANNTAFGSAPITLYAGKLQMQDSNTTSQTGPWSNTLIVPEGASVQWNLPKRWNLTNKLLGKGKITVNAPYVRNYFRGDWSAFEGTIAVTGQDFIIDNKYGFGKATLSLASGVKAYHNSGDHSFAIGALAGVDGATLGDGSKGANVTWTIGAKGIDSQYAGVIQGTNCKLNKVGQGTLTLSGANVYTGMTTVSAGTLQVANTSGSATGTASVKVQSGATLAGTGRISGVVTVYDGGTVSLTDRKCGTLTFASDLTLQTGATLSLEVNTDRQESDLLKVGRNLSLHGLLTLTDLADGGGFAEGQQYHIAEVTSTLAGAFDSIVPVLTAPLAWDQTALAGDGLLKVTAAEALPEVPEARDIVDVRYFDLQGRRLPAAEVKAGRVSGIIVRQFLYRNGGCCTELHVYAQ